MKGLVGAEVEPETFAVISVALADAIREHQVRSAKLRKARRRYEKSPLQSPARELARKKLAIATRHATRAEVALIVLADKEPIAYPTPEPEIVPEELRSISAFGALVGAPTTLSKRLDRGTPADLREALTPRPTRAG